MANERSEPCGTCGQRQLCTCLGRQCEHGQLKRSCNICELENEISELLARLQGAHRRLARVRAALKDLPQHHLDHAVCRCATCQARREITEALRGLPADVGQ